MKKKTSHKPAQKKKKPVKKKSVKKTAGVKSRKKPASKKPATKRPGRILSPGEQPPFRIENAQGKGIGLVVCDHASNRVPRVLKDLGLKKADLKKHVGWDIGAEDASLHIGRTLDMPVVLANYSRLVLDLNRAPHHEECIAEESDHIKIPANAGLSKAQREQRLKEIFWPYQNKIGKMLDVFMNRKQIPVLLAIHSLTPEMDGVKRPWHISILWNREEKIAKQIVREIRNSHPDLLVGENEPYTLFSDRFPGSTVWRHAEERNLPYVFVEFRQDLINTKEKAVYWANLFMQAMRPVLENPLTYQGRKMKPRKK
jgi:predicted N-formylglutamate amidohydrolase